MFKFKTSFKRDQIENIKSCFRSIQNNFENFLLKVRDLRRKKKDKERDRSDRLWDPTLEMVQRTQGSGKLVLEKIRKNESTEETPNRLNTKSTELKKSRLMMGKTPFKVGENLDHQGKFSFHTVNLNNKTIVAVTFL